MVLKKIKRSWCVVHGKMKGHIGEKIKCYSVKEFGSKVAKQKAKSMHTAIILSQLRAKGKDIPFNKPKKKVSIKLKGGKEI